MSSNTIVNRVGLGPLEGDPTFFNSAALGLTPVIVTLATPSDGRSRVYKVKIVNPNASALLAWKTVPKGSTAPIAANMTADFTANGASHILAGSSETFAIPTGVDLYIVASAAASSASATSFLFS